LPGDTINEGLARYSIGQKLRRLRLRKSMGLVELSSHTGLSPALLSKLERDRMHPTLPTLLRIAMVFSVGLEHFFNPDPAPVLEIVRKATRLRFPDAPGAKPNYFFESLDFPAGNRRLNAYWAEFAASDPDTVRTHQHDGVEVLFVLSGKVLLRVGEHQHVLAEGDSVYFDSSVPHSYSKQGKRPATAMVVTTA
jgi:transcriptional regulator with XRE-family HTH domain